MTDIAMATGRSRALEGERSDRHAAGRTDDKSSMCRRCESIKSSPLSSKHCNERQRRYRPTVGPQSSKLMMTVRIRLPALDPAQPPLGGEPDLTRRAWHTGRRAAPILAWGGSVPQVRAGSPMRSVVCKTAREGLTPSRLSTANAVRTTWLTRLVTGRPQGRCLHIPRCG